MGSDMKIYTSYFAKLNRLPKNITPVSICGKAPDWYTGLQYKQLAPKFGFFQQWKNNHDNQYYIEHFYSEVLNKLDCKQIISDFEYMAKGNDIALICYEKPDDFCHRHLVAKWLTDNGYTVEEYKF